MAGSWELMLHGFAFLQYNKQGGPRGDEQFGSLNWAMLMASRPLAGGKFEARTMLSLDPWSVTPKGYPVLLQVGEVYDGAAIFDRQHPHDFWMELGVLYEREVTKRVAVSLYAAPSGEPALGPVAFMHRPSAMDDPVAPLGHHWQDATHTSFGVLTVGMFTRVWKLEGSYFNGREADQHRFNFDPIRLDSYSGRLTLNPAAEWSMSLGYGFLKSPEILEPDESIRRMTGALLHGRRLGRGQWATSLVWGANKHDARWSHTGLLESEAILDNNNTLFGRVELAERTGGALKVLTPSRVNEAFYVSSLSLGYIRELDRWFGATTGLGVRGTVSVLPGELTPQYGSRTPTGLLVFLRVRPFHATDAPGM